MRCLVLDLVDDDAVQRISADIPKNPVLPDGMKGEPIGLRWFRHIIAEAGGKTVYYKPKKMGMLGDTKTFNSPPLSQEFDTLLIIAHADVKGNLMAKKNGDKYDPESIINGLKQRPDASSIDTVIIWACHSEAVGNRITPYLPKECKIIIQRGLKSVKPLLRLFEATELKHDAGALIRLAFIITSNLSSESFKRMTGKPAGWGNIGAYEMQKSLHPLVWMFLADGENNWLNALPAETAEPSEWRGDYFYAYQIDWLLFDYNQRTGGVRFHARIDDLLETHFQLMIEILDAATIAPDGGVFSEKPRKLLQLPLFPKIPGDALTEFFDRSEQIILSTKLYRWIMEVFGCINQSYKILGALRNTSVEYPGQGDAYSSAQEGAPIILFAHAGYVKRICETLKKLQNRVPGAGAVSAEIDSLFLALGWMGVNHALILIGSEFYPAGYLDTIDSREETEKEGYDILAASIRLPIIQYGQLVTDGDEGEYDSDGGSGSGDDGSDGEGDPPNFHSVKEKIFQLSNHPSTDDLKEYVCRIGSDKSPISVPPRLINCMRKEKGE